MEGEEEKGKTIDRDKEKEKETEKEKNLEKNLELEKDSNMDLDFEIEKDSSQKKSKKKSPRTFSFLFPEETGIPATNALFPGKRQFLDRDISPGDTSYYGKSI